MVMSEHWYPERGDIFWLSFSPHVGHEQAGRRPALIISPGYYNYKAGFALVCPITSMVKGYPFEVALSTETGVSGVILADQVKSMDWRGRRAELITTIPHEAMEEVFKKVWALVS
jgi:mRNA interferase MazF